MSHARFNHDGYNMFGNQFALGIPIISHTEKLHRSPRMSLPIAMLAVATALGVAWRVVLYLLDLDVTLEEALLLHNIVQYDYAQLIGPMDDAQAAPPAYRWVMRWLVLHTPGEWGVRGLSLIAGLGALGLFVVLARMLLRGAAFWLAVALFSVSHPTATYASRAKQYTVELFCALVIYVLAVAWLRRPRAWPILLLAITCPLMFWFAYTSIYVGAGAGIVITTHLAWQHAQRRWLQMIILVVLAVASLASFGLLYHIDLAPTMTSQGGDTLRNFWDEWFLPLSNPLDLFWWLLKTHAGRMYAYPVGDKNFACIGQLVLWLAGVVLWWQQRSKWTLAVLLAPQLLLLAVSAAKMYPYGGHPRISIFLAPSICLFIAYGGHRLSRMLARKAYRDTIGGVAVFFALVAIGAISIGVYQRVWVQRSTPRDLLHNVAAQAQPNDLIVSLGRALPAANHVGGSTVYEYYLYQYLGDRAHWIGEIDLERLHPGERVWVLHLHNTDETQPSSGIDAWLAGQVAASGRRLTQIDQWRCDGHPKESSFELRLLQAE